MTIEQRGYKVACAQKIVPPTTATGNADTGIRIPSNARIAKIAIRANGNSSGLRAGVTLFQDSVSQSDANKRFALIPNTSDIDSTGNNVTRERFPLATEYAGELFTTDIPDSYKGDVDIIVGIDKSAGTAAASIDVKIEYITPDPF